MKCKKYREYISVRSDGALNAIELAELENHLASCTACSAFALELENAKTSLTALAVKAPVGFTARVLSTAYKNSEKPKNVPLWQSFVFKGALTTASLCIVLAAAFLSGMFNSNKKCDESTAGNSITTPTCAQTSTYGTSNTDGGITTTEALILPGSQTLSGVSAVVRGTVVSKDETTVNGNAYTLVEILVSKQYYSLHGSFEGAALSYSCLSVKDISVTGGEVIVFLSYPAVGAPSSYTVTDTVFLYIRVESESCLAGNFIRFADNIGSGAVFEVTDGTERYALADVEEKINTLIERYIKQK